MEIKLESVEIQEVGTITSQLQYTITAYTIHSKFPGEQIKIIVTSDKNESFKSIRTKLKTTAENMWANLMKDEISI